MVQGGAHAELPGLLAQREEFLEVGMAEADAHLVLHRHLHDLHHLRQHLALLAHQPHAAVFRVAGAAPEAQRGEGREPDHLGVGVLKRYPDVLGVHAVAHAAAAVDLHPILQLSLLDEVVDVALHQVAGVGADVPVVLEGQRAHARLGGVDGDLDHVLGAVHEVGIGVDVAVDGVLQQLVLDARIDLEHLGVVLEHLVEVILGVELTDTFQGEGPAYQDARGLCVCCEITHAFSSLSDG